MAREPVCYLLREGVWVIEMHIRNDDGRCRFFPHHANVHTWAPALQPLLRRSAAHRGGTMEFRRLHLGGRLGLELLLVSVVENPQALRQTRSPATWALGKAVYEAESAGRNTNTTAWVSKISHSCKYQMPSSLPTKSTRMSCTTAARSACGRQGLAAMFMSRSKEKTFSSQKMGL